MGHARQVDERSRNYCLFLLFDPQLLDFYGAYGTVVHFHVLDAMYASFKRIF